MIDKRDLHGIIVKTEQLLKKLGLAKTLEKFPKSLLVFRLSLDKSQRDFLNHVNNCLSHPTLIKHENGRSNRMTSNISSQIEKTLGKDFQINKNKVLENFEKFEGMQKGHLDSKKGKELQKIWVKKTTREQRKKWGRLGAVKTNKNIKLTRSENLIKKILNELEIKHRIHEQIKIDKKLSFNVDFLIEMEREIIIEVTERQTQLTTKAQAIAFRSRLIKEKNNNLSFIVVVPDNITLLGEEVLNRSCDKVFKISEIEDFKKFLNMITFSN